MAGGTGYVGGESSWVGPKASRGNVVREGNLLRQRFDPQYLVLRISPGAQLAAEKVRISSAAEKVRVSLAPEKVGILPVPEKVLYILLLYC